METLKKFCTRRRGRRDSSGTCGPDDALDEELFKKMKDGSASDDYTMELFRCSRDMS